MTDATTLRADLRRVVEVSRAVSEAIRDAGRVPSGTLYAAVMGMMTLTTYQRILDLLKEAKLIKEEAHELIWIGPAEVAAGDRTD